MRSTRKAALWYASQEWPVFPIWPVVNNQCSCGDLGCKQVGKHPVSKLVANGHLDATIDQDAINLWWDQQTTWNIGTPRFLRIDVDVKYGGIDAWRDLVWRNGLDNYVMAKTPSGGQHWYFQPSETRGHTNRTGDLPTGIDVRGCGGGYTILPPSNHLAGIYKWGNHHPREYEIPIAPDWLLAMLPRDDEETEKVVFDESVAMPDINGLTVSSLVKAILQRDKSRIDQAVISSLVQAGCSDGEILAIFTQRPPTCKMKEKGNDGQRYLALSISNARKWIAKKPHQMTGQGKAAELMR